MSIEFPLLKKPSPHGMMPYPQIPVEIKTSKGFLTFPFLLDTGADFTLFPASMKDVLGMDSSSCSSMTIYGIERQGKPCILTTVQLKIAPIVFDSRCLIWPLEEIPFILGRMDFFSKFNVTFDNQNEKIMLTPI